MIGKEWVVVDLWSFWGGGVLCVAFSLFLSNENDTRSLVLGCVLWACGRVAQIEGTGDKYDDFPRLCFFRDVTSMR